MSDGAWGDHIALTAIVRLFSLKINTFTVSQNGTNVATVNPCGEHEINIGLIMQYHFVGLDKLILPTLPVTIPTTVQTTVLEQDEPMHDSEVDNTSDTQPMEVDHTKIGANFLSSDDPLSVSAEILQATIIWSNST